MAAWGEAGVVRGVHAVMSTSTSTSTTISTSILLLSLCLLLSVTRSNASLDRQHQLTLTEVSRGLITLGKHATERFAHKVLDKKTLKVLAVGGSNTESFFGCAGLGCDSYLRGGMNEPVHSPPFSDVEPWLAKRVAFFSAVAAAHARLHSEDYILPVFLREVAALQGLNSNASFAGYPHTAINVGVGATSPLTVLNCPGAYLYPDADLVIVEYGVNSSVEDGVHHMRYLVDTLLRLPSRPAVLLFDVNAWCINSDRIRHTENNACRRNLEDGNLENLKREGEVGIMTEEFSKVVEALDGEVAHYSVKRALMPLMEQHDERAWPLTSLTQDGIHPFHVSGKCKLCSLYADMLVGWTKLAIEQARSTTPPSSIPPPPPAAPRDGAITVNCLNLSDKETIAYTHDGSYEQRAPQYRDQHPANWFFTKHPLDGTDEQKRRTKPGLVAVAPGAKVGITLITPQMLEHHGELIDGLDGAWTVSISYLAAKDHVGAARIDGCEGVCSCDSMLIDASLDPPATAVERTREFSLKISRRPRSLQPLPCLVVVRLESVTTKQPDAQSAENKAKTKFKLLGVSVSVVRSTTN